MPLKIYLTVAALLFIFTGVTVAVSKIHLGEWNAIAALAIASVKGLLVALFFMHLLYDKKIYGLIVGTAIVILAIFIGLTMADVLRRGDIYEIQSSPIVPQAKIYKQATNESSSSAHEPAIIDSVKNIQSDSSESSENSQSPNQTKGVSGH